jgi:hypothetical protein
VKRLWIALAAYVLLGLMAWQTLSDEKIRLVTLVVLSSFALRTLAHRRDARNSAEGSDGRE